MARRDSILLAAALVALVAFSGCKKGSSRLAGHWRGVRAEGVTVDAVDAANAFVGKMAIDVNSDVITVTTASDKQSGHYKVIAEDKTKTVIVTDRDTPTDHQVFTFVDPKTMKWTVVAGKAIVFVKE